MNEKYQFSHTYTALPRKKRESTLLHTYVLNEILPAHKSCKENIFEQILIKYGSLSLYASFGTFCVQIGQLFESQ